MWKYLDNRQHKRHRSYIKRFNQEPEAWEDDHNATDRNSWSDLSRWVENLYLFPPGAVQGQPVLGAADVPERTEHLFAGEERRLRVQPLSPVAGAQGWQSSGQGGGNSQRGAPPALEPGIHALRLAGFRGW